MRSIFCLASATASSFFAARLLSVERARMGRSAQESGRCRRTIATIAALARCRSRDIAELSPSGALR